LPWPQQSFSSSKQLTQQDGLLLSLLSRLEAVTPLHVSSASSGTAVQASWHWLGKCWRE